MYKTVFEILFLLLSVLVLSVSSLYDGRRKCSTPTHAASPRVSSYFVVCLSSNITLISIELHAETWLPCISMVKPLLVNCVLTVMEGKLTKPVEKGSYLLKPFNGCLSLQKNYCSGCYADLS